VRNTNKQAYRFIEKVLGKGPSLEAAPNAVYTGDTVRYVIIYAATTQRTVEAAVTVLRDRGRDAPSPDAVHRRLRDACAGDLVEFFTPCLEEVFAQARKKRLFRSPKRVAVDIHVKPFQRGGGGNGQEQGQTGHHHVLGLHKPRHRPRGLQDHPGGPAPHGQEEGRGSGGGTSQVRG